MPSANEINHQCLDLLEITWFSDSGEQSEEFAALLEISRSGGILHTDCPIADGTRIRIRLDQTSAVDAEVEGYEQDQYGWYLKVKTTQPWFPNLFQPAFALSTASEREMQTSPDGTLRPDSLPLMPHPLPLT